MWVVETAVNLLGFLTFAAAATVETLLGKKGLAVESLMELSHLKIESGSIFPNPGCIVCVRVVTLRNVNMSRLGLSILLLYLRTRGSRSPCARTDKFSAEKNNYTEAKNSAFTEASE